MMRIYEVGPRDGLQNEKKLLTLGQKLDLIESLLLAGLRDIEIGAFVRPDRVPQMAGTDDLYRSSRFSDLQQRFAEARFWALVPNEKGLDRALECGARGIAVFGGATETFVKKNIGMTVSDSIRVFSGVVKRALTEGLAVRGYISVCWVCPYEGEVQPEAVLRVIRPMLDMGIPQISLGDTLGRAHPAAVDGLLSAAISLASADRYAVHFHDTYGMALANIDRSLANGISVIDASIGGLGGCPYAPGAAGNVVTEDVYTLLEGYRNSRMDAVVLNAEKLLAASAQIQKVVGRKLPSKRLQAWLSTRSK